MVRVNRHAGGVVTRENAGVLLPLLGAVMARLAQRLQSAGIVEDVLVTLVRDDMVNHCCRLNRTQCPAQAARWFGLKLMPP